MTRMNCYFLQKHIKHIDIIGNVEYNTLALKTYRKTRKYEWVSNVKNE